ncbi:MAG TPA: FAD binding domain-containing protein [Planctomycetaceae bacterium]|nr:FAD binding domain-containing protein [Planctomycetaceae bacterium]
MTVNFEYASPETEAEAVELLAAHDGDTAVLAGGTDLPYLLQADLLKPRRVVDVKNVQSMRVIEPDETGGVVLGSLVTLEEALASPLLAGYASLGQAIDEVRAIQIQQNGTVGGDLCHLPNCWYFRNGYGLLGLENGQSLPALGDNRYHAILGNTGPAKFVSASRFAPALIAWGAEVRLLGPNSQAEEWLPLEFFYQTPRHERQGVTVLKPGQVLTHVRLPAAGGTLSASYDVLQLNGLDWPLASAACCLHVDGGVGGVVRQARVVLGHVAPVPWVSQEAARALVGRPVTEDTAVAAASAAVERATPLSNNAYKVQIARAAVKRAILRAAGLWTEDA